MFGYALYGRNENDANGRTVVLETDSFQEADIMGFSPQSSRMNVFSRDGKYFVARGVRYHTDDKSFDIIGSTLSSSNAAAFSWDSTMYAVGATAQPRIRVYDTSSWVLISPTLESQNVEPRHLSFSADGSYLVATYLTGTNWVLYETATWSQVALPTILGSGYAASFSPGGDYLAVAHGSGNFISIFTFPDLQPVAITSVSGSWATWCDWSPDGRYCAFTLHGAGSGGVDSLAILDAHSGFQRVQGVPLPYSSFVSGIQCHFSPDGKYLAFVSNQYPSLVVYSVEDWGVAYGYTNLGSSFDAIHSVSWSHSPVLLHTSGQVVDRQGYPAPDREVVILPRGGSTEHVRGKTNADGRYSFYFIKPAGAGPEYNRVILRGDNDPDYVNDLVYRILLT